MKNQVLAFLQQNIKTVGIATLLGVLLLGNIINNNFFSGRIMSQTQDDVFQSTFNSNPSNKLPSSNIFVHIEGCINKPGVYTLDTMSRLENLIESAEGLKDNADKQYIKQKYNYSQKLKDEDKFYFPCIGEEIISDTAESKININSAPLEFLMLLDGVGNKTAIKIYENRPYSNTEELLEENIVTESVFSKIKEDISI